MYSIKHVRAMLERARLGEDVDLKDEVDKFIPGEILVSQHTLKELYKIGSITHDESGDECLLMESRKYKIKT